MNERSDEASLSIDDTGGRKPAGTVRLSRSQDSPSMDHSAQPTLCPVCHLKNPATEMFCAECGFLLASQFEEPGVLPTAADLAAHPHLEDAGGRTFALRPGVNTLGRENTDILLPDRSVSRYHGTIVYDEEREIFSVEDNGSTNGSRLNGEPLRSKVPRAIRPGDDLTFGNVALRFVAGSPGRDSVGQPAAQSSSETTAPIRSAQILSDPAGRLLLLRGNGPREVLIEQGVTTIGRTPDNKLCLSDDRYVSSHHARIEVEADLFLLLDMGSTNGTFLNGLRLTTNAAIAMSEGDEVLVGGSLFQFHKLSQPPPGSAALDRTLVGAPSLDHLSAARVGEDRSH